MTEGELLWTPDPADAAETKIARFMRWLSDERGRSFDSYEELRVWSVNDLDGFWAAVWDFFAVASSQPYDRVLSSRTRPTRAPTSRRWSTAPSCDRSRA